MLPRECDNDDCDYETYDDNGVGRARWIHVPPCEGPMDFGPPTVEQVRAFLAFLTPSPE